MSKEKKNHIRKPKNDKKAKSKYDEKIKIDASFEELLKMAADSNDRKNIRKKE